MVKVAKIPGNKDMLKYDCYGCFVDNQSSGYVSKFLLVYEVVSYEEGKAIVDLFNENRNKIRYSDYGIGFIPNPSGSGKFHIIIGASIPHGRNLSLLEKLIATDGTIDANKIAEARAL